MKIQILRHINKQTIKEGNLLHSVVMREMNMRVMNSKIINLIKK